MPDQLTSVEALLKAVEAAGFEDVENPTFMEIAGYPHWELASSNILAHFLDPEAGHGLGSALLGALLEAAEEPAPDQGLAPAEVEVRKVETEVATDSQGRIDLLVETDTHIIGIENKIYAGLHNDLRGYHRFLEKRAPDEGGKRDVLGLVLSPWSPRTDVQPFRSVTYAALFEALLPKIGAAALDADPVQLSYLLDFAKTIRNLTGAGTMNTDFMELLDEHRDAVKTFFDQHKHMQDALRRKAKAVATRVDVPEGIIQSFWRTATSPTDFLVHTVSLASGCKIQVDAILLRDGWRIEIWSRSAGALDPPIEEILAPLGSDWHVRPSTSGRWRVWPVGHEQLGNDDDLVAALGRLLGRLGELKDGR